MIAGEAATFSANEAEILISPLVFTSEFLEDSVVPGGWATLR